MGVGSGLRRAQEMSIIDTAMHANRITADQVIMLLGGMSLATTNPATVAAIGAELKQLAGGSTLKR